MVSGVGMHMTKHAAPSTAVTVGDTASGAPGRRLRAGRPRRRPRRGQITDVAAGPARVAAYSVVHGRDGGARWGLAVVDLPDGTRAYARCEDDDLLARWEAEEWVGRGVELRPDGQVNRVQGA